MRALRLIGLAAQAEGLILRRQGATMGRTAVLSFAAGAFGITALAMLHVAGWIWFKQEYGAFYAALIAALMNLPAERRDCASHRAA